MSAHSWLNRGGDDGKTELSDDRDRGSVFTYAGEWCDDKFDALGMIRAPLWLRRGGSGIITGFDLRVSRRTTGMRRDLKV